MLFTSETKVISVLIFDLNEVGRSRRHLGARHHHAGDHLRGGDRGQPHSRLRRRAPAQHVIRHGCCPSRDRDRRDSGAARSPRSTPARLPPAVRRKCEDLLIDVVGLCVTARNEDYVKAALAGWDDEGACTAIGHARTMSAAGAAFVNGTAAHGEDFDDTFEGGPVHAGAVIVPAVLAACERHNPDGPSALLGIAVGVETMCRLSLVVPKAVHKAGFHPTAVFGAMAAAAGVGAALGLDRRAAGRRARHRRLDGGRHHRISGRGRLDQAAASGLGGAIGPARGAARARRLRRPAHGVRGRARPVPRLRPHHRGRLRRAHRRFRRALGDARRSPSSPIRAGP